VDLNKGLSVDQLDKLIGPLDYRLFLNAKNEIYRERGMKNNPPSRDEALKLMAANPNLIRRPIVVDGKKVLFGFSMEEWSSLA
jgi:arsenate reductase-like glutaredoxin family protein